MKNMKTYKLFESSKIDLKEIESSFDSVRDSLRYTHDLVFELKDVVCIRLQSSYGMRLLKQSTINEFMDCLHRLINISNYKIIFSDIAAKGYDNGVFYQRELIKFEEIENFVNYRYKDKIYSIKIHLDKI